MHNVTTCELECENYKGISILSLPPRRRRLMQQNCKTGPWNTPEREREGDRKNISGQD